MRTFWMRWVGVVLLCAACAGSSLPIEEGDDFSDITVAVGEILVEKSNMASTQNEVSILVNVLNVSHEELVIERISIYPASGETVLTPATQTFNKTLVSGQEENFYIRVTTRIPPIQSQRQYSEARVVVFVAGSGGLAYLFEIPWRQE